MGMFDSIAKTFNTSLTGGSQTEQGNPSTVQVSTGKKGDAFVEVTNVQTDFDAIETAIDLTGAMAESFVDGQLRLADEFVSFGSDALGLAGDSVDSVERISRQGFDLVEGVTGDMARVSMNAVDRVERISDRGFDLVEGFAGDVMDFGNDAIASGERSTREGFRFAESLTDDALGTVESVNRSAFNFAERVFGDALSVVNDSTGMAIAQSNAALKEVNRDASERENEKAFYVVGAAVLAVMFVAFKAVS